MAPKKTQLGYIQCNVARRASFKKRRLGLLRKVQELSKLCDVPACALVYSEDPSEPPVHWPENHAEVEEVLLKLRNCPERNRKTMNQESYIDKRVQKYTQQLRRLQRKNHEAEMHHLMQLIYLYGKSQGEFTTAELKSLRAYTEEKVKELQRRAEFLAQGGKSPPDAAGSPPPSSSLPSPPPPPSPTTVVARDDPPSEGMGARSGISGDFQVFPHNITFQQSQPSAGSSATIKEEVDLPDPQTGVGHNATSGGGTLGYLQGNFEIGGSSGANRNAEDAAIAGRGVLLPFWPVAAFPYRAGGRVNFVGLGIDTHGRGAVGGYANANPPFSNVGRVNGRAYAIGPPLTYVGAVPSSQIPIGRGGIRFGSAAHLQDQFVLNRGSDGSAPVSGAPEGGFGEN